MSRSGYTDDCDEPWQFALWRGTVTSAIRGKRGQAFLKEALAALDALPEPTLIPNNLAAKGSYCTLGAVGRARGTAMPDGGEYDEYDDNDNQDAVAALFSISRPLASEIMWMNDDAGPCNETPRARWERMRKWIVGCCGVSFRRRPPSPPPPVSDRESDGLGEGG